MNVRADHRVWVAWPATKVCEIIEEEGAGNVNHCVVVGELQDLALAAKGWD